VNAIPSKWLFKTIADSDLTVPKSLTLSTLPRTLTFNGLNFNLATLATGDKISGINQQVPLQGFNVSDSSYI
jgi:hypothetical protein